MHPQDQQMGDFPAPADRAEGKSSPSKLLVIGAAAVGTVLLVGVGAGGYLLGRSADESETAAVSSAAAVTGASAASSAPSTKSRIPVSASDFKIETTVLEQKCFGSAGCSLSYTIKPTFMGSVSDLEGRSLKVVYEVTGGDEPQVGYFSLEGTNMRYDETARISTPSADAVLAAQVTQVLES